MRDVRTVVAMARGIVEKPDMAGVAHHAGEDAEHQARYVCAMWRTLREGWRCSN